jgi:gliding motility-associated-like protein
MIIKKTILGFVLAFLLIPALNCFAQDVSNKGKEFWFCFPSHLPSSELAKMAVFITSDKNSSGTISVNGFNTTFSVTANQIAGPIDIPYANAYILDGQSGTVVNKGIHITVNPGQPAVVAFAHIYAGFRSEATLILPVSALGKKYYSTNYWQASTNNSRSQFQIVATEANTVVQYQLRRNGVLDATATTATLNNPGDVLQIQNAQDLTGSVIESIASGTGGCKKIAVFSGSSALAIGRLGCSPTSYDPLLQQCYPVTSWGKNFGIVPFANNSSGYHLRVTASEDNTRVNFNGTDIMLNAGQFYPATSATATAYTGAMTISSDKPVSIAQYLMSANCSGSTAFPGQGNGQGDPDMIILNPVEQSIRDINIFSSNLQNIRTKYLNVYIKSTIAPSFRINGAAPLSAFVPMPSGNGYSYLVEELTGYPTQSFRLTADSGFNAITYGMGDAESYGYSAGTNVKDFSQYMSVSNQFGGADIPVACKGAPSTFSITFPYKPAQIIWQFNGLFPDVTLNGPDFTSSSIVDGKTLYKYDLPGNYTVAATGTYPIKILAQNPTADGCNGVQELEYELNVYDPPTADFNFTTNGCVSTPVAFVDNSTNLNGRPITHWHWNFGDNSTTNDVSTVSHTYTGPGSYTVKYTVITDIGCKADTSFDNVVLNDPPVAAFTPQTSLCAGRAITFTDNSTVASGTISKWTWNFGDASPPVVLTTNASPTHTFAGTGPYNVTLQVETASGCMSTVVQHTITLNPNPLVAFNLPNVCLPTGAAQFNSSSTISDGSESQFTYLWEFGDLGTAAVQNPLHNYTTAGPFNVALTVTSNKGCDTKLIQNLTTVYAEPQAAFTAPADICLGSPVNFTDQSSAPGSTITTWDWNFQDGVSSAQNPVKTFANPGTYNVTLSVTSAAGCRSVTTSHIAMHPVTVNSLPTASFDVTLPGCLGQGVTFTSTSVPNSGNIVKWTWNYGDASNLVATNGAPVVHAYSSLSVFNSSLQVETDKGCVSTVFPKDIVIYAVPVAGFTSIGICVNDVLAPLTDVSTPAVTAWQWKFGDVNATPGNPNTSTLQNPTHHFTVAGTYNVELVATNGAGCKDTVTGPVAVNGGVLTPAFNVDNTTPLCSNKSITIKDASLIDAGKILKLEIYWDPADPTAKTTDDTPVFGETYTHTYPEFGSPATKTYNVRYVISSGMTCISEVITPVTMLATPQLAFGSVLPLCTNNDAITLTAQLQSPLPGTGVFSGAGVGPGNSFDPEAAGAGTHTITYTYTSDNGCANSVTQDIVVNPTPDANAGPDRFLLEGGFVVLMPVQITSMPVTYLWTPATYLSDATKANAQASPPTDFTYNLTVTSDKGCKDEDQVFVKLLKSLVIPNIFSPNGDGINDRWVIEHLENYPGCVVQLYNRYGQLVQRYVNYTTPWDGKINGKDAPVGTYYYIIDPQSGRKPITGYVDIIR